jgi:cyclophilin family peptidyl-prolyl cis-trans isomerase
MRFLARLAPLGMVAALALSACSSAGVPTIALGPVGSPGASPSAAASSGASASASPSAAASAQVAGCPTSQPAPLPTGQTRTVTIATSKGDIVIKVEGTLGPNAAGNFVALAQCGYYDNVIFHRLVPGFVIQGGDGLYGREPSVQPGTVGTGGPGYTFADDAVTARYTRGTVAMANSGPDTNGSQFFICLADLSSSLPPNYSIFGHVTSGMDVVDAIAAMPNSGGQDNLALQPVAMQKVTVTNP